MPRTTNGKPKSSRKRRARVDPAKPPRPLNKFFLFKQAFVASWPDPKPENKIMVAAAGDAWKRLSPAEMAYWTRKQEEVAAEHALKYPDYKYQPAKKGAKSATRAAAGRRRAENMHEWSTPSLAASSLESSPASSSAALSHPPSMPSSSPPPSPLVEPVIWMPPTGGPNEESVQESTLQPLSELDVASFECQVPQPSRPEPRDDWTQYIDPDLLAMDESGDLGKGLLTTEGSVDSDSDDEVQLQTQQISLLPPPPSSQQCVSIDPSLLCP